MIRFTSFIIPIVTSTLLVLGWSQNLLLAAAPARANPATQVDFPRKGRAISIIVGAPRADPTTLAPA